MKLILIMVFLFCLSCAKTKEDIEPQGNNLNDIARVSESNIDKDTNEFTLTINDTVKVKVGEEVFKRYETWFNEPIDKNILHPDAAWNEFMSLDKYRDIRVYFSSEAGQDDFCLLYTFLLRRHATQQLHDDERTALISAYQGINDLKKYFQYGGTFFGHMENRIYAYAEYSIYTLDKDSFANFDISNEKDIFFTELKEAYLKRLRNDTDTPGNRKPERKEIIIKKIDEIAKSVTNAYLLKEVKQFYADHYNYWL